MGWECGSGDFVERREDRGYIIILSELPVFL